MARKKKKQRQKAGTPAYMMTFGDLMNLLLVVFISLLSVSRIDDHKFKMMISAFQRQLGVMPRSVSVLETGAVLVPGQVSQIEGDRTFVEIERAEDVQEIQGALREIQNNLQGMFEHDEEGVDAAERPAEVEAMPGGLGLRITFASQVTFDLGRADIKPEFRELLDTFADRLRDVLDTYENAKVYIEGHTDSVPLAGGIYRDNWGLSSARALSVLRYFIEKGYNPEQLMAAGMSDTRPHPRAREVCGDSLNCPINRRIVIRIQYMPETEPEDIATFSAAETRINERVLRGP